MKYLTRHKLSFLISFAILLFFTKAVLAETLTTKTFKAFVTKNCPKDYLICNNVAYYGIDLINGASIRLAGKTVYAMCKNRITPCHFQGYEFRNRNYVYFLSNGGKLQIYQIQSGKNGNSCSKKKEPGDYSN